MIKLLRTLSFDLFKNHTKAFVLIVALRVLGPSAGLMYILFLFMGSFTIIDLNLSENTSLLFDVFVSVLFFLQHSVLIRRGVRQRLTKVIPDEFYNAFYGITSIVCLFLVMIFWQKSQFPIAIADDFSFWLLRASFFLSIIGFYWGVRSIGSFDALGVKPIRDHIYKKPDKPWQLSEKGPYRWVRHPLYLFVLILIWSCPVLTIDRMIFNIMWTFWIAIGTYLEDRDLHREFGSQYLEYSSRVPMLIPYRIPRNKAME